MAFIACQRALCGLTALRSAFARPYHSALPVICVGNITVGGTGKTPLVSVLCTALQAANLTPVILSRGYGGRLKRAVNLRSCPS